MTFDAGVEQRLAGNRLRLEATAFHHDYRDQINFQIVDFSTFQGTFVNVGRTRARAWSWRRRRRRVRGRGSSPNTRTSTAS